MVSRFTFTRSDANDVYALVFLTTLFIWHFKIVTVFIVSTKLVASFNSRIFFYKPTTSSRRNTVIAMSISANQTVFLSSTSQISNIPVWNYRTKTPQAANSEASTKKIYGILNLTFIGQFVILQEEFSIRHILLENRFLALHKSNTADSYGSNGHTFDCKTVVFVISSLEIVSHINYNTFLRK